MTTGLVADFHNNMYIYIHIIWLYPCIPLYSHFITIKNQSHHFHILLHCSINRPTFPFYWLYIPSNPHTIVSFGWIIQIKFIHFLLLSTYRDFPASHVYSPRILQWFPIFTWLKPMKPLINNGLLRLLSHYISLLLSCCYPMVKPIKSH